jgi:hypothetical protein
MTKTKAEMLADARRERVRFEAEVAERHERVARGEYEYHETPMKLVRKTHEPPPSLHLTDAEEHAAITRYVDSRISERAVKAYCDQRIAAAIQAIKSTTLPETVDIIVEGISGELAIMRKQITALDSAITEISKRVTEEAIIHRSRDAVSTEKVIKEINAVRRSMATVAKQVEGMRTGGDSGNVRRLHAN